MSGLNWVQTVCKGCIIADNTFLKGLDHHILLVKVMSASLFANASYEPLMRHRCKRHLLFSSAEMLKKPL